MSAAPSSVPAGFLATLPSGGVPQVGAQSVHAVALVSGGSVAPASQKKKAGAALYAIGAVVALAAVAAGGFLIVRPRMTKHAEPIAAATVVAPVAADPAAPSTRWQDQIVAQNTAPTPDVAPADTAAPAGTDAKDLAVKPPAPVANTAKSTGQSFVKKGAPDAPPAAKNNKLADQLMGQDDSAKPAPSPAVVPPAAVAAKDPNAPAGAAGLNDAMKTAAGPTDSAPTQGSQPTSPAFAAGTVPQRPSQGAVTGAIGAALPGARACLSPDDAVSRATMVFGSDGTVQSVNVHGAAAGKPAEACIKAALSKAKVPPFAEATYTANITVRH